jgi:hypothetical protein
VLDETHLATHVDVAWNDSPKKDFAAIRHELNTHGLDFQEVEREIEVLVIRDAPLFRD